MAFISFILTCVFYATTLHGSSIVQVFTTSPPVTAVPFMTTPLCATRMDLVLAIDSSASVSSSWNEIINNAQIFISNFQVSDTITRVGIIDFGSLSNVYTPLDTNNNDENCYQMLEQMRGRKQNGESWIELGLDRANDLFRSATPVRNNVRKVLVIYTDGEMTSKDHESLRDMIKSQHDGNVEHYVVKVSNNTEKEGLKIMMSTQCHIFQMKEPPPFGKASLEDSVCYNLSSAPSETHSTAPPLTLNNKTGSKDFCMQAPVNGPCFGNIPRYYYNHTLDMCMYFYYGGCGGNPNNFGSIKECEETCKGASQTTTATPKIDRVETPPLFTTTPTPIPPLETTPPLIPLSETELIRPLTKCNTERHEALMLIHSNVPTLVQIFVPECDENGKYKKVQHHEGTGNYWCVDPDSGELVEGSKTENKKPPCAETTPAAEGNSTSNQTSGDLKPSEPITVCEKQRDGLVASSSTANKPECNVTDGLFLDIQKDSKRTFCVNRYTGDEIEGTSLTLGEIPGVSVPECPEKSECEKDVEYINRKKYESIKTFGTYIADIFIPICDKNGLYEPIQYSFGSNWCVDIYTGTVIDGTNTPNGNRPICPVNTLREECILPKVVGPCRAAFKKFYFNIKTLSCEEFIYGGCNGNDNQFESMIECEHKCGSLTQCKVQRAKAKKENVLDPLKCDKGGDFKEVQHLKNGTNFCVDRYTGLKVEGIVVNDQRCEVVHKPKCQAERDSRSSRILGSYQPQCDENGHYQSIQNYGSTGEAWCVHKFEGTEIAGTKKKPGEKEPICPVAKNENCLLPKTPSDSQTGIFTRYYYNWLTKRCVRFNYDGKNGNGNNFMTLSDCMIACHLETSYPEGPLLTKSPPSINTPILQTPYTTTTTVSPPVFKLPIPVPEIPISVPKIPVPEPEGHIPAPEPEVHIPVPEVHIPFPEPEGAPEPVSKEARFYPKNKCGEENDFISSRAIYDHVVGSSLLGYDKFICDESGDFYAPLQRNVHTNKNKWCVDTKTGHLLEGTLKLGNQPDPICTSSVPTHSAVKTTKAPNVPVTTPAAVKTVTTTPMTKISNINTPPSPSSLTPMPEPEPAAPTEPQDYFHPSNPCSVENDFIRQRNLQTRHNNYLYACTTNSGDLYFPLQANDKEKWCVDTKSGHLIPGKKVRYNEILDCFSSPSATGINPVDNTHYASTTSDKFHPAGTCLEETSKVNPNMLGAMMYDCEVNGNYKPKQRHGSTGEVWCVDVATGKMMEGKHSNRGEPEPVCETIPSANKGGIDTTAASDNSTTSTGSNGITTIGGIPSGNASTIGKLMTLVGGPVIPLGEYPNSNRSTGGNNVSTPYTGGNGITTIEGSTTPIGGGTTSTGSNGMTTIGGATTQIGGGTTSPGGNSGSTTSTGGNGITTIGGATTAIGGGNTSPDGNSGSTSSTGSNGMTTIGGATTAIGGGTTSTGGNSGSTTSTGGNGITTIGGATTPTGDNFMIGGGNTTGSNSMRTNGSSTTMGGTSDVIGGISMDEASPPLDTFTNNPNSAKTSNAVSNLPDLDNQQLYKTGNMSHGEKPRIIFNKTLGQIIEPLLNENLLLAHYDESNHKSPVIVSPSKTDSTFYPTHTCLLTGNMAVTNKLLPIRYNHTCEENGDFKKLQLFPALRLKWCVNPKSGHLIAGTLKGPDQFLTEQDCDQAHLIEQSQNEIAAQCQYKIGDNLKEGENLKKLGCYHDNQQPPRPFPIKLLDESSQVATMSGEEWKQFIKMFVCRCAQATRKRGWYSFGIQNQGECYSGPDEGRYAEDREAKVDMCVNENEEACNKNDKQYCSGVAKRDPVTAKVKQANFVYMIVTEAHKEIKYIEYDRKKRYAFKKRLPYIHKRFIHQLKLKSTKFFKNSK